jgi:hypothetical protein
MQITAAISGPAVELCHLQGVTVDTELDVQIPPRQELQNGRIPRQVSATLQ